MYGEIIYHSPYAFDLVTQVTIREIKKQIGTQLCVIKQIGAVLSDAYMEHQFPFVRLLRICLVHIT